MVFQIMTPLVSPFTKYIIRVDVFQNVLVAVCIKVEVETHVPKKRRCPPTKLHDPVSQKTTTWNFNVTFHVGLKEINLNDCDRMEKKLSLCYLSNVKPRKRKRIGILAWRIFNVKTWRTWVVSFTFRLINLLPSPASLLFTIWPVGWDVPEPVRTEKRKTSFNFAGNWTHIFRSFISYSKKYTDWCLPVPVVLLINYYCQFRRRRSLKKCYRTARGNFVKGLWRENTLAVVIIG